MTIHAALDRPLPTPRSVIALPERATSHTKARWGAWLLAGCLAFAPGCGDSDGAEAAPPSPEAVAEAKAKLDSLRQAFAPIRMDQTGDKVYAWQEAKRKKLEELERSDPVLAAEALATFHAEPRATDEWRNALLGIAARGDPEGLRPLLESLSLTYDRVTSLGVRNEAVRLLCVTSPAVAAELFEPIVLAPRSSITYPPKEQMLRHWITAARSVQRPVDRSLASIATDIAQPADVRYVAIDELAHEGKSEIGRKALETVLVESGADGLLRRKAAQSMREALPREELCALLFRISENESDPAFLYFISDMWEKHCK